MKICEFSKNQGYVGKLFHIKKPDGTEESGIVYGQEVNENNELVIKYAKSEGRIVSTALSQGTVFDVYDPENTLDPNNAPDVLTKPTEIAVATFLSHHYADSSFVDWNGWEFEIEALDIHNSQTCANFWKSNLWTFKVVADITKIDKRQTVHSSREYKLTGNADIYFYKRIGGSASHQGEDFIPYVKKVVITKIEECDSKE